MAKVLITDDSATARMIVQRCIEVLGWNNCEFLHAANGFEAIEIVKNKQVDLIITDIVMPVMDGRNLLKRIKVSPKLNHIPVFVISSLANPALEEELKQFGVDRLIYKPVSPPKLLEAFEEVFGKEFREK
ncbi:MAG: response regulator [Candidatus Rifleibacteriota bacterium]